MNLGELVGLVKDNGEIRDLPLTIVIESKDKEREFYSVDNVMFGRDNKTKEINTLLIISSDK